MNLEQALIEKDNLEAALMGEIRKFEAATGLLVARIQLIRLDTTCYGEARTSELTSVKSDVLLEGAAQ